MTQKVTFFFVFGKKVKTYSSKAVPHLIQHHDVVTKDGECTIRISLDLNINLNSDGSIRVDTTAQPHVLKPEEKPVKEDNWVIPDFKGGQKIKFGKTEKEIE